MSDVIDRWSGWIDTVASVINTYGDFFVGETQEAIIEYGVQSTTLETSLFAGLYMGAKFIPPLILLYMFFKKFLERTHAIAGAILVGGSGTFLVSYILKIRPTPIDHYNTVSSGPMTLVTAFQNIIADNPRVLVMIISTSFVFLILSFVFFYAINFFTWGITAMFMQEPLYGSSGGSAKAHAMLFTFVWLFYMTMETPANALISTAIIGIMMVFRRRKSSEKEEVVVVQESEEQDVDENFIYIDR